MTDSPGPSDAFQGLNAIEAAEQRAFERGQNSARLKAEVEAHERRLNMINGSIARHAQATENLAATVNNLSADFRQSIAVAQARAKDAAEAAERQVSTRTFLVGLIGAVAAVGLLLVAFGHG